MISTYCIYSDSKLPSWVAIFSVEVLNKFKGRLYEKEGSIVRRFYPRYYLRWLVGTKHFPESKNTSQNPKTLPRIQKHFTESKTLPRIQKHVPESKTLPRIQNVLDSGPCFWILGSVFGFWAVFLDSEKCFVPTSHRNYVFVLQRFWFS